MVAVAISKTYSHLSRHRVTVLSLAADGVLARSLYVIRDVVEVGITPQLMTRGNGHANGKVFRLAKLVCVLSGKSQFVGVNLLVVNLIGVVDVAVRERDVKLTPYLSPKE